MTALALPDIASQNTQQTLPLDWVGMCGIALPIVINGQQLTATADAGVSLDDDSARGIHMSRLYLALENLESQELNPLLLKEILQQFVDSHEGLSVCAFLRIHTQVLLKQPALVSSLSGWRSYPMSLDASLKNGMFHVELNVELKYSSTCPCSAALARQLIQQKFVEDFADQSLQHSEVLAWLGSPLGIVATPHSQRSTAHLRIQLKPELKMLPIGLIINSAEKALGTAVQTAVKRADEQAFALANGQNLMFCEDAARRLNRVLKTLEGVNGFHVKVVHAESLHSHDAVAESHWDGLLE